MDEEVWREVASAAPSDFHHWANSFAGLQTPSILECCWLNADFRENYRGCRDSFPKNVERFHKKFLHDDFHNPNQIPSFKTKDGADGLVKYFKGGRAWGRSLTLAQAVRILERFPKQQAALMATADAPIPEVPLRAEVVTDYLEQTMFHHHTITSLLTRPMNEIKTWQPKKYQDPIIAYLFGDAGVAEKLDNSDLRHLGYLSMFNVRNEKWAESFKNWLTRHGSTETKILCHLDSVEMVKDLGELDEDFFTDNRLKNLNNLMRQAPHIKLKVPEGVSIKLKELLLVEYKGKFTHLQERLIGWNL